MLKKLVQGGIMDGKGKRVLFNYNHFIDGCKIIADSIIEKYGEEAKNIGLIGLARGALPMLTTISHLLNNRNISILQIKTDNTVPEVINDGVNPNFDKYILLEDIIYRGKTTKAALDYLKKQKRNIVDVYAFIIDERAKAIDYLHKKLDFNYVYEINEQDWIYFFWEEDIRALK